MRKVLKRCLEPPSVNTANYAIKRNQKTQLNVMPKKALAVAQETKTTENWEEQIKTMDGEDVVDLETICMNLKTEKTSNTHTHTHIKVSLTCQRSNMANHNITFTYLSNTLNQRYLQSRQNWIPALRQTDVHIILRDLAMALWQSEKLPNRILQQK